MKNKKTFNLFDLAVLLILAAVAAVCVTAFKPQKTEDAVYTLEIISGTADGIEENDTLVYEGDGVMGRVISKTQDGEKTVLTVKTEVVKTIGGYYSDSVHLKDGAEYTVCKGVIRVTAVLRDLVTEAAE